MADGRQNVIGAAEDGQRAPAPGYDHRFFEWDPFPARPALVWPGEAQLAVTVTLDLRAIEWEEGRVPPPGGRGPAPFPDYPRRSHREFGHRVGVFRLLEVLMSIGIPVSFVVDVLTAEEYRPLMRHIEPAASELLAGGLSANRPLTSEMDPEEEAHYIDSVMARLEARLGARPKGWLSPEHSESVHTLELLAHAGLDYVADWGNDEQAYATNVGDRPLWMFPLSWELSDLNAMFLRQVAPWDYADSLAAAVSAMTSCPGGRVLGLHIHPWVSGQAFRVAAVQAALVELASRSDVWLTTPHEVVSWTRSRR